MTNITEFEACPLQRGCVVQFGRNLQNLEFSSFPVGLGRMFLQPRSNFFKISIPHFTENNFLQSQQSFEKVIGQNYTSICFCYVGLFDCLFVCIHTRHVCLYSYDFCCICFVSFGFRTEHCAVKLAHFKLEFIIVVIIYFSLCCIIGSK